MQLLVPTCTVGIVQPSGRLQLPEWMLACHCIICNLHCCSDATMSQLQMTRPVTCVFGEVLTCALCRPSF